VVLVEHDDIVPHAGLDRAAARLRKLALLERPPPHTTESLRPILDAVGGLSPATPDQPVESFATGPDGGVRLTFTEPAAWVWFAAAGGRGIPPAEIVGGSGVRAPVASGVMICDLRPDYRLSWTYLVDDVELGRFSGHPDGPSPGAAHPGAGDPPPLVAERILGAARDALRRPFAVPAGPVRPLGAGPSGGGPGATVDGPSVDGGGPPVVRWAVAFLGGGSVVVDERDGVPCGTELIG